MSDAQIIARTSDSQNEEGMHAIALEVLETVRSTLMMSYRYLNRALWHMPFAEDVRLDLIGTDGRTFSFSPEGVLRRYSASSDESLRDYLHLIMHCIFYHPFVGNDVNPLIWDLSCDIVTEAACLGIAKDRFPSKQDVRRTRIVEAFGNVLGNLSAEKVYRYIMGNGISPKELDYFRALFIRDDHGLWYHDKNPEPVEDDAETATGQQSEQNEHTGGEHAQDRLEDNSEEPERQGSEHEGGGRSTSPEEQPSLMDSLGLDDIQEDASEGNSDTGEAATDPSQGADERDGGDDPPQDDNAKQEWEDVSKQVKLDLETHAQIYGTQAGGLVQSLRVANRRKADYRSFLRRFAQIDEELSVNDEEFDLVYYNYGLRRFGNMPLIEPLEYRETKKIREFVVAIDTSGSVEGELVKRFVEETYNLLKSTESFFTKVKVRIMQCDARVQSDIRISSIEEFERYMRHFELAGFGGTDFRPVFARVQEHLDAGEFENLKGLIYFTDGYGAYPTTPPDYETVFVFADEGYSGADVPPWAMRLYLDTSQLEGNSS